MAADFHFLTVFTLFEVKLVVLGSIGSRLDYRRGITCLPPAQYSTVVCSVVGFYRDLRVCLFVLAVFCSMAHCSAWARHIAVQARVCLGTVGRCVVDDEHQMGSMHPFGAY